MIGPFGRQGLAATLRQHCSQKHSKTLCGVWGIKGVRIATKWTSCVKAPWDFLASLFCGVIGYEIAAKIELGGRKGDGEVLAIFPFVRPSTPHTLPPTPKRPLPSPPETNIMWTG